MTTTKQETPRAPRHPKSRIPRFKSIEEAAEFWDTHSTTEFEDEWEPVEDIRFVLLPGPPNKALTVRLPEQTLAALKRESEALGVRPSVLVRRWILERLYELKRRAKTETARRS